MKKITEINFQNRFVANFNGDDSGDNTPRQTPGALYSLVKPTPVKQVSLLAWNTTLGTELGIEQPEAQQDIDVLGGNLVTTSMQPYAACYAGHQFGNWAGQLGDGRAITLGEVYTPNVWELQLKGPGLTPYSRSADGRAVLRSSLREYLMSEAMHYLGVPTTRALSLVATGQPVLRDMFYNGNAAYEPGAIVLRVAPSFLRFGNFEMAAARQETENLEKLVNWTIENFYPRLANQPNKILLWFKEVVERTAKMIVEWMRVGFVHGVMNTDNMSILGLTIDYGPFSFVDNYDNNFTPNTTDLPGRRYAFGQQPFIGKWNLACLAGALIPLGEKDDLVAILDSYDQLYWSNYYPMMAAKLGIDDLSDTDLPLIGSFEKMLQQLQPDMTIFFQLLAEVEGVTDSPAHFNESSYEQLSPANVQLLNEVMQQLQQRISKNKMTTDERKQMMSKANPRFILRNYLLHTCIENLEKGDDTLFKQLQEAIKEPYGNQWDMFFAKRPNWASSKAGCSMLSCSS